MAIEVTPIVEQVMTGKDVVLRAESPNSAEIDRFRTVLLLMEPELQVEFAVTQMQKTAMKVSVNLKLRESPIWMQRSLTNALIDTSLNIELMPHEPA